MRAPLGAACKSIHVHWSLRAEPVEIDLPKQSLCGGDHCFKKLGAPTSGYLESAVDAWLAQAYCNSSSQTW
ncbi:hypothetical protein V5799_024311 [Amblyomma americanum]|uniref:Uncharacterized protein n=1 Tax=Amblyomma americanum TaxID=6943 RepID=A0AAQ4ECF8_AMBAM